MTQPPQSLPSHHLVYALPTSETFLDAPLAACPAENCAVTCDQLPGREDAGRGPARGGGWRRLTRRGGGGGRLGPSWVAMSRRAKDDFLRHYTVSDPRTHPKGYTEYKVTAQVRRGRRGDLTPLTREGPCLTLRQVAAGSSVFGGQKWVSPLSGGLGASLQGPRSPSGGGAMGGRCPLKGAWTAVPGPESWRTHAQIVVSGHQAVNFFKLT